VTNTPELKNYASFFKGDEVVLFPTDTVVGLGCRFDSPEGIAKIRKIKGIMDRNPLAVLISDQKQLDVLKVRRSRLANLLMDHFWPGALTIVMTSEVHFPCSGEANTLGLRMPDADFLRKIIDLVGAPIAATSANPHGRPAPERLEDISNSLRKQVDHVIDYEVKPIGLPSTVVKIEGGILRIMREGAITRDEISSVVGDKFE
jgi:L-threonylcarbamoyladenylate synthase